MKWRATHFVDECHLVEFMNDHEITPENCTIVHTGKFFTIFYYKQAMSNDDWIKFIIYLIGVIIVFGALMSNIFNSL